MRRDSNAEQSDNRVFLRGVLAAEPVTRTLPSGDELCSFRVTVPRPAGGRVRVDSIDCSSTCPAVRKVTARCLPGDLLELTGSIHRRFWRSVAGAPASRYEVDVQTAKAPRRSGPTPALPHR